MNVRTGRTLLAGALFASCHFLSTPGYGLPVLAWGAYVPFLYLAEEAPDPAGALRRTFLAALAGSLPLYYWIAWTVAVPGRVGWAAGGAAALIVSAFVALHHGVVGWAAKRCTDRWGGKGALAFPALAGAMELGRVHLFPGFPWMLAGYTLAGSPLLRQGASLVGAAGLGVVLFSASALAYHAIRHGGGRGTRILVLALAATLPAALALYGAGRTGRLEAALRSPGASAEARRVAVVQGAVDQSVKWDPSFRAETMRIYGELTAEAAPGSDLVVWPETAAPFFYGWEREETERLRAVAARGGVPLLFGVPWMEESGGRPRFYNSVLLLDGAGGEAGRYDKRHLVPFGEYVPLRFLLGYVVNKLTEGGEDFSTGKGPVVLRASGLAIGPSVCYEAIFPAIQRETVLAGATVLVNVTNDSWFGDTVAPWQHLAMARMRAVETGRPMVRAANAGVSALVTADGALAATLGLGRRGILAGSVVPSREVTPYVKWGDCLPVACCIITLLLLAFTYKGKPCPRD